MKQVLSIFLQFFTPVPGSIWLINLGLVFLALAVLGAMFPNAVLDIKFIKISFVCLFAFPYLGLPGYFRTLISNHRLSLIPGFQVKAGFAALLFTVMTSIYLQTLTILPGLETLAPGTALLFFIIASVYMGYTQLTIASRYGPYFIILSVLLSIYVVFTLVNQGSAFIETNKKLLSSLTILVIAGWGWGLYLLASRNYFKPPFNMFAGQADKEAFNSLWKVHDKYPQSSSSAGTLLLGLPDGYLVQLQGGLIWLLVVPLTTSLALAVFNVLMPGDPFPPFHWVFLGASAFLGGWSTFANGEFAARTRLLWLRFGTDREMLWQKMEKTLMRSLACIGILAVIIAVFMSALELFGNLTLFNYLIFIPVMSFYLMYLSLLLRIANWHKFIHIVAFLGTFALVIPAMINGFSEADFYFLNLIECLFVILGLLLRYLAHKQFIGIDWHQVQPIQFSRMHGIQTQSR